MTQPSPVTGKEDIVERLRNPSGTVDDIANNMAEAADIIEQSRRSSGVERGEVIEECARVAEQVGGGPTADRTAAYIATRIRSLREAGGGDE